MVDQGSDARFAEVQNAYAAAAERHGLDFGTSAEGARARAASMRWVRGLVDPPARLLDIGCDTGFEAVHLANQGYEVLGLDVVDAMCAIADERRASQNIPPDRCRFRTLRARDVGELADEGERFDLAYSAYGTLNLEPALGATARGLARLLPEDAPFIVGLLNPAPLFEMAVYPFAGRFKGWRKTLQDEVRLRIHRGAEEAVTCDLRFPREFAREFSPWFQLERTKALHILLPPPGPFLRDHPALLQLVTRFERAVGDRWPWNRLGYFSLLALRRTDADPREDPPT